jgi:hypothetical protein
VNVGTFIVVCVILILPAKGRAQENDEPALSITMTGIASHVVSSPCSGRQVNLLKAETLTEPQNRRTGGQGTIHQRRSWVRRHPVLTGLLIGASIGTTLAATGDTEPGTSKGAQIAFTTGVGAGIGALVGLAFR